MERRNPRRPMPSRTAPGLPARWAAESGAVLSCPGDGRPLRFFLLMRLSGGVGSSGKGERSHANGAGTHKASVPTQPPIGETLRVPAVSDGDALPLTGGCAGLETLCVPAVPDDDAPPLTGGCAGMAGKSEPKPGPGKGTKRVKSNPDQAAMNGGTGQKKSTRRKKGGSSLG